MSRTVGGVTTYNIWDGWNLLVRYDASNNWIEAYDIGAGGLIEDDMNGYYYHDASGSTSHLADNTGHLLEWYRYDLQGTPVFYNFANTQQSASAYGIRHLFTGQQWYSELGLYDLRNRFYSPGIGRFLQPDPIRFDGDPTNLYRYCGNNPVNHSDPNGLQGPPINPFDKATYPAYNAQYYQSQPNFTPYASVYNEYIVPTYNTTISIAGSAPFRFTIGGIQMVSGAAEIAEGIVAIESPVGGLGLGFGLHDASEGMENVSEAVYGNGFDLGPRLEPYNPGQDQSFNYYYISYETPATPSQPAKSAPQSVIGTRSGPFASFYANPVAVPGPWGGPMYGIGFGSGGFYGPSLGIPGAMGVGWGGGGAPNLWVKYL